MSACHSRTPQRVKPPRSLHPVRLAAVLWAGALGAAPSMTGWMDRGGKGWVERGKMR
jgi:hypothetical protein